MRTTRDRIHDAMILTAGILYGLAITQDNAWVIVGLMTTGFFLLLLRPWK